MARLNTKAYSLIAGPTVEPVSVSDVKTYARIDGDTEDSLLALLIKSARESVEEYTKRSLCTQTWELTADYFGEFYGNDLYYSGWELYRYKAQPLQMSRGPWQSITSVRSISKANVETTVDTAVYTLDAVNGRIMLNDGFNWPTDLRDFSAVKVRFVAGYGDASAVPNQIKQAIIQQATAMYETRCNDLIGPVKAMVDAYRLPEGFGAC